MDSGEMLTRIVSEQLARVGAVQELRDMGVEPSPADTSAWLAADPRTRRRLMVSWAAMQNEINPERE